MAILGGQHQRSQSRLWSINQHGCHSSWYRKVRKAYSLPRPECWFERQLVPEFRLPWYAPSSLPEIRPSIPPGGEHNMTCISVSVISSSSVSRHQPQDFKKIWEGQGTRLCTHVGIVWMKFTFVWISSSAFFSIRSSTVSSWPVLLEAMRGVHPSWNFQVGMYIIIHVTAHCTVSCEILRLCSWCPLQPQSIHLQCVYVLENRLSEEEWCGRTVDKVNNKITAQF